MRVDQYGRLSRQTERAPPEVQRSGLEVPNSSAFRQPHPTRFLRMSRSYSNNSPFIIQHSQFRLTPYASPFTPHVRSLPARSQDRLDILRLLIDGSIPGKTRLQTERGHRLNQRINLRTE